MYHDVAHALGRSTFRYGKREWTLQMPSLIQSVSWLSYEAFLQSLGDYRLRHTYDRGRLEVMPRDSRRERVKCVIRRLVQRATEELRLPVQSVGSMTLLNERLKLAIQPDESFYLASEPLVRGKEEYDPTTDPPTDLVIDVDFQRDRLGRQRVYAALLVPEMWRYDGRIAAFFESQRGGSYRLLQRSKAFPFLGPSDLMRFLDMRHDTDENSVIRAFVARLREEHANKETKKSQKR
jgi:Uma2 family endonuclease